METLPAVIDDMQSKALKVFEGLDVSVETKKDYCYRITMFLDFIKARGFTRNTYLDYKRELADRNDFTTATKNKYLATAKVFLRELNRQGLIPADITQNIKTFTQSKKHKKEGLSEDDIALLSERLKGLSPTPQNYRIKAIITLLTLQGLRQIEIIRLDIKDIDLVAQKAFIQGKGRDDKEPIDLHPESINALKHHINTNKIADGALFVSKSNNGRNQRLSVRALREIVKTTLSQLGIDKSVHGFRHYFTTKLIKTYKGDLLEVARYTRHKSLEMLQVYNDNIKREADLPRYYKAFAGVSF
jgi:integrase/recombinase XerC